MCVRFRYSGEETCSNWEILSGGDTCSSGESLAWWGDLRQWGVFGLVGRLCSLGRLAPVRELCSGGEICSSGLFLDCFQKARACPFLVLPLGPSDPQTLVPAPTHIPAPPPSSIPKLLCVASAPMGQITLGQVPDVRPPSPKVRFGVLNYVRWFCSTCAL